MNKWIKVTAVVFALVQVSATTRELASSNQAQPALMASDPSNPLPKPNGRRGG
jgi:hypothetical protein